MFVIRDTQLETLQALPRQNMEREFSLTLFRHYPQECHSVGEERIRAFVKQGIRKAIGHGYLAIDTIGLYITLMMILGCEFDSDPQLGWAHAQLDDFSLPPSDRIRVLFQNTIQYLDCTAGEHCEHLVRAMLRLRKYDFETPIHLAGEELASKLASDLVRFYPEKAIFQGDVVNQTFILQASERAAEAGFKESNGIAVWVTLAFMLGMGFSNDPIFWWAADSLAETRELGEKDRVARLVARAYEHLEASLRMSGEQH